MKLLVLLQLILLNVPSIEQLRKLYILSVTDKTKTVQLISITEKEKSKSAVVMGYNGVAKMIMAKHAFNPINKFNYFLQGKATLEQAIQLDKSNPELRVLRLTIQLRAPSFLGYNKSIESDRAFIRLHENQVTDATIKKIIAKILTDKVQ